LPASRLERLPVPRLFPAASEALPAPTPGVGGIPLLVRSFFFPFRHVLDRQQDQAGVLGVAREAARVERHVLFAGLREFVLDLEVVEARVFRQDLQPSLPQIGDVPLAGFVSAWNSSGSRKKPVT